MTRHFCFDKFELVNELDHLKNYITSEVPDDFTAFRVQLHTLTSLLMNYKSAPWVYSPVDDDAQPPRSICCPTVIGIDVRVCLSFGRQIFRYLKNCRAQFQYLNPPIQLLATPLLDGLIIFIQID